MTSRKRNIYFIESCVNSIKMYRFSSYRLPPIIHPSLKRHIFSHIKGINSIHSSVRKSLPVITTQYHKSFNLFNLIKFPIKFIAYFEMFLFSNLLTSWFGSLHWNLRFNQTAMRSLFASVLSKSNYHLSNLDYCLFRLF